MSDELPLCVRCAQLGATCCQRSQVLVTQGDRQRITAFTGLSDAAFVEDARPQSAAYEPGDDDPVWRDHGFAADGTRPILRREPGGDCTFLGPAGCRLPLEVRPLVCRLYPFDYDHVALRPELADGCPTQLLRPGQSLLAALDMAREPAERWRSQLYAELRAQPAVPRATTTVDDRAGAPRETVGADRSVRAPGPDAEAAVLPSQRGPEAAAIERPTPSSSRPSP